MSDVGRTGLGMWRAVLMSFWLLSTMSSQALAQQVNSPVQPKSSVSILDGAIVVVMMGAALFVICRSSMRR